LARVAPAVTIDPDREKWPNPLGGGRPVIYGDHLAKKGSIARIFPARQISVQSDNGPTFSLVGREQRIAEDAGRKSSLNDLNRLLPQS
jgi:hypothetical protein